MNVAGALTVQRLADSEIGCMPIIESSIRIPGFIVALERAVGETDGLSD